MFKVLFTGLLCPHWCLLYCSARPLLFEPSIQTFSQLDPPSFSVVYIYNKVTEKTGSFNRRASLSCSHGEVYPHLSQHLTPGREGVRSEARGQHLSHCELEPTWTPVLHRGQRETGLGWFLGPRMCELNRSCAFSRPACMDAFERVSLSFLIK